jgi:hypothetical protein
MAGGLQPTYRQTSGLVDVLDRILDKGLVIAGDIRVSLAEVELLTIRIRLLVCSIDKAEEIGLDWWRDDPNLSIAARKLSSENRELRKQVDLLERRLATLEAASGEGTAKAVKAPAAGRSAKRAPKARKANTGDQDAG